MPPDEGVLTVEQQKQTRESKIREAEALLAKAAAEKRELTPEEDQQFRNLMNEVKFLGAVISGPSGLSPAARDQLEPRSNGTPAAGSGSEAASMAIPARSARFRDVFCADEPTRALGRGQFKNWTDFVETLTVRNFDPRLETRTMVSGVPSDGGFLIPEEFGAMLMDTALEAEIVRPRATNWPLTLGNTRKVPCWDGADHSSGLFGGLVGTWLRENVEATPVDAKVRSIELSAKKLGIFVQASRELTEDGVDFGRQLQAALVKAIAWYLDYSFLRGTGVGEPLGVLNSGSRIEVAKEGGQAANTFVFENAVKMWSRLAPASASRSVWVVNPTVLPQIYSMHIDVGAGGSTVGLAGHIGLSPITTMFGRPILVSEKVPALGSAGDVLLADFSQYAIAQRKDLRLDVTNAVGWRKDALDFCAIVRIDGLPTWDKPVTPKNGDTLSWAVTLATRAP